MAPGNRWGYQALVQLPEKTQTPFSELGRRALLALTLLMVSTLIVYIDRESYSDNVGGGGVSFIDALYYSTVTITTTGYGDITPVAEHARLINALIVTPLRIAFLVLLVGTTLEVLANQGRRALIDARWRKRMRGHTVVMGYGTTGRSAVKTLRRHERAPEKIIILDNSPRAVEDANRDGYAAFEGDVTSRNLLRRAEISKARDIIVSLSRDDTAILTTLTVRQLNPGAHITVSVREAANVALVRQSGADSVITSADAVGRLVGISSINPHLGALIEDLLSSAEGLEVAQRLVRPDEVGLSPADIQGERVLGVVRHQSLRRFFDPTVAKLETGDELVVVRKSTSAPLTPRQRREQHDNDFFM
jgi:voltage-gated potassium channel